MPKVSIVIPTFNQGPFIGDCLRSLQSQSFRDFEVIIQDALSTDQTQGICESYAAADPRFRYHREKDAGQSDAINKGLGRSLGQYWSWICSDDYYANTDAIAALVRALDSHCVLGELNVVGAYGKANLVDEMGTFLGDYWQEKRTLKRSDFHLNWPLSQPSSLLLRAAVVEVGGVIADLNLGMDLDLFIKILSRGRVFTYVDAPICSVRVQPDSKSVKLRIATAENALKLVRRHFGSVGDPESSAYYREFIHAQQDAMRRSASLILKVPGMHWLMPRLASRLPFLRRAWRWSRALVQQAQINRKASRLRRDIL